MVIKNTKFISISKDCNIKTFHRNDSSDESNIEVSVQLFLIPIYINILLSLILSKGSTLKYIINMNSIRPNSYLVHYTYCVN